MGVQHLAGRLWDTKRRSHIAVTTELEVSLKKQALHLAALGLLLRLNSVEWELEGVMSRQPSLQRSELKGGRSSDDGRMNLALKGWELGWAERRK